MPRIANRVVVVVRCGEELSLMAEPGRLASIANRVAVGFMGGGGGDEAEVRDRSVATDSLYYL